MGEVHINQRLGRAQTCPFLQLTLMGTKGPIELIVLQDEFTLVILNYQSPLLKNVLTSQCHYTGSNLSTYESQKVTLNPCLNPHNCLLPVNNLPSPQVPVLYPQLSLTLMSSNYIAG